MHKFTTLELHIGDRPHEPYTPGETREIDDPNTVKHLVDVGVLGDHDSEAEAAWQAARDEKAEGQAPSNKSEGRPPKNKAA